MLKLLKSLKFRLIKVSYLYNSPSVCICMCSVCLYMCLCVLACMCSKHILYIHNTCSVCSQL